MSNFTEPTVPSDPAEITHADSVAWMKQLRKDRLAKGITYPRFVAAIKRSGYQIEVAEYREIEAKPLMGHDHIIEGFLSHAYAVLNGDRITGSPQHRTTAYAMRAIADERIRQGLDYNAMADKLMARGVNAAPNTVRTAEQGITRDVPFAYVAVCAEILNIEFVRLYR